MSSFTTDPNLGIRAIATVVGGEYNGTVVYLADESKKSLTKRKPLQIIQLHDHGKFELYPDPDNNRVIYISGPSGSGKTTFAANYIEKYLEQYPNANFYICSRLEHDPSIDHLDPEHIVLDESIIDRPILIEEFPEYSIVLFDDIDSISDKEIKKSVFKTKDDILQVGRHKHISIVCTSHLINGNDRATTRTMLNEASTVVFFPNSGSTYGITYYLKCHAGLSPRHIHTVLNDLPGRAITLIKGYPQIIVSEKACVFVKSIGKKQD